MSYIRLFENLAVLEKWYGMESRSVMEPAVLLLVSLPCTIGIELRSFAELFLRFVRPFQTTNCHASHCFLLCYELY